VGAGTLLQRFGDAGVAGVFQVRQDKAEGAGVAAAQTGGLRVGAEVMFLDHLAHALDRSAADALLFGLAVDHIAGGRNGNTGQTGNISEFQTENSFRCLCARRSVWKFYIAW